MLREPGAFTLRPGRPRQPRPTRARLLFISVTLIVFSIIGLLMAGVALVVFLGEGQQVSVRARVLSEHCHPQSDLATGQMETRCDAAVEFRTMTGEVIRAKITDAFPYEFSGTGRSRAIGLRYDTTDPTQPYKQSNYMSPATFAALLVSGLAATVFGGWMSHRVRRQAARQVAGTLPPGRFPAPGTG
jgi:hypothetical protein